MTEEPLPSWSSIADWYDELLVGGSGPHETALKTLGELLPDVDGARVVDVACGQGIASRLLAERGAQVVGVDSSPVMIDNARRHGTPVGPNIEYRVDDGETLGTLDDDSVDGATCQLALMDIPDLQAALVSVARVLRPGGWFAFVIGHPCVLVPGARNGVDDEGRPTLIVTDYFRERFWRSSNPEGVRRAGNHHRTLSTYLNSLVSAGFHLEEVREPEADALLAEQQPLYTQVPIFLAARARVEG